MMIDCQRLRIEVRGLNEVMEVKSEAERFIIISYLFNY